MMMNALVWQMQQKVHRVHTAGQRRLFFSNTYVIP